MDFPDTAKGCGEAYAIESFFLGRKSCFDHVESTSKASKIINCGLSRMTRIPTSCIEHYVRQSQKHKCIGTIFTTIRWSVYWI